MIHDNFYISWKRSTWSSASVLLCFIVSTLIVNVMAEASLDGRNGLRRGYNLKAKRASKLSPLLNSLGDSGFCSTLCNDICLALDTKDCNDICNDKCNSLDSNSSAKSTAKQGEKIHRHATQALTSGDTCFPSNVRTIRIDSTTGEQINMFQVLAYTPSGSEVASNNNNAIATQSSTYTNNTEKFGPSNSIDRDYSTFSHTDDANAYWEVNLGSDYEIEYISIRNRYCQNKDDTTGCLCRLTNATISLLDSQRSIVSSIDAGNTCGTLTIQKDFSHSNRSAKTLMIKSTTKEPIQLYELQAYSSGVNVAEEGMAIQSSTFKNETKFAPSNAIDSNNDTFSHTDDGDSNPTLEINLNDSYIIDDVVIINRWCKDTSDPNGCLCRLSSAVITLFDENDDTIVTRTLGNTCGELTVEEKFTSSCQNQSPSTPPSFPPPRKPSTSPSTSPSSPPSLTPSTSAFPSFSPTSEICEILESCHDGDLCTMDTAEYVDDQWTCKFNYIDCDEGWICDGSSGLCKLKWNVTNQLKIMANDGEVLDFFGHSVAVYENLVVVGAPGEDGVCTIDDDWFRCPDNVGAVYVFGKNETSGEWEQTYKLIADDGKEGDDFGRCVAVSDSVIVVGADSDCGGAAYIFEKDEISNVWSQIAKLIPDDCSNGDYFGSAVAVSGDVVVVGASFEDKRGSAIIFEKNISSGEWQQTTKLQLSAINGRFGQSVSVSDNIIVVSAYRDVNVDNGNKTGSVYIVERNETSGEWEQTAKLIPDDGVSDDYFGYSVDLSGDVVVIGAPNDDDNGGSSGSIYIFEKDNISGAWKKQSKVTANDGTDGDWFGYSVSISGDVIIAGAYRDDSSKGAAYVIEKNGTSGKWEQEAKLTANDGLESDFFGDSVAVSGDVVVVGAYGDDDNGELSGSSYIFKRH